MCITYRGCISAIHFAVINVITAIDKAKIEHFSHIGTVENKKKKYLDTWPNTSVSIWPFKKVLGHIHKHKFPLQITEGKEQYKLRPNNL